MTIADKSIGGKDSCYPPKSRGQNQQKVCFSAYEGVRNQQCQHYGKERIQKMGERTKQKFLAAAVLNRAAESNWVISFLSSKFRSLFNYSIIQTVSYSAHALPYAFLLEHIFVLFVLILPTLIRVANQIGKNYPIYYSVG